MAKYIIIKTEHSTGEIFYDSIKLKENQSAVVVETDNINKCKEELYND